MNAYSPLSSFKKPPWVVIALALPVVVLVGCSGGDRGTDSQKALAEEETVSPAAARSLLRWTASAHGIPGDTGILQMNGTAIVETPGGPFLYSVGGNTGPVGLDTDAIYYAPIQGASVGPWKRADATLQGAGIVYHTRSTVGFNGRLYVVGGNINRDEGFTAGFNGIRVFEADSTGNIPADKVVYYYGKGDGAGIRDVNPSLQKLESAAVVVPSRRRPGDGILHILGGDGVQSVRSVRIDAKTGAILGCGPKGELADALVQSPPLPQPVSFAPAVAHGDYVYLLGGRPISAAVYYAPVLDDDTLGAWRATTAPLPEERFDGGAVSFGGAIYYLGGTTKDNDTTRNAVFRATPNEKGDILAWESDTAVPVKPGIRRLGATATSDALFLVGGRLIANVFLEDEGAKRIADNVFSPNTWIATLDAGR